MIGLWDVVTGGRRLSVAFSPDGTTIVSVGWDNTVDCMLLQKKMSGRSIMAVRSIALRSALMETHLPPEVKTKRYAYGMLLRGNIGTPWR